MKGQKPAREIFEDGRAENGQRILSTEVTKMQKGWKRIGLAVVSLGLALALIVGSVVPAKAAHRKR